MSEAVVAFPAAPEAGDWVADALRRELQDLGTACEELEQRIAPLRMRRERLGAALAALNGDAPHATARPLMKAPVTAGVRSRVTAPSGRVGEILSILRASGEPLPLKEIRNLLSLRGHMVRSSAGNELVHPALCDLRVRGFATSTTRGFWTAI